MENCLILYIQSISSGPPQHAHGMHAAGTLAPLLIVLLPTNESQHVCSSSQGRSTTSSAGAKFHFAKLSPLLADPGCRSPAQLCLPASVRLFIPGCTCVFAGMRRVGKLQGGSILYRRVHVCLLQHLKNAMPSSHPPLPTTFHTAPPRHLSTREAFPERTANKVGQVCG